MKGYKAFNENLQCYGGFQYEIGETYELEGGLEICKNGFHFCETIKDCFDYYPKDIKTRICEIESLGEEVCGGNKYCTDKIKIIREIPPVEISRLMNQGEDNRGFGNQGSNNVGDYNRGCHNIGDCNNGFENRGDFNMGFSNYGDCNRGFCNQGDKNQGSHNKGERNCGHFNKGNYLLGCLCTEPTPMYLFNKPSTMTYKTWIDEGYGGLIARVIRKRKALECEKEKIKELPNFDTDIFEEITGVRI